MAFNDFLIVLVMPCLTDIVGDLQEQVKLLKDSQHYPLVHNSTPSRPSSTASTSSGHSGASTPSRAPSVASTADVESEMASFLKFMHLIVMVVSYMPITSRNMHMLITSTIFLRSELSCEFF